MQAGNGIQSFFKSKKKRSWLSESVSTQEGNVYDVTPIEFGPNFAEKDFEDKKSTAQFDFEHAELDTSEIHVIQDPKLGDVYYVDESCGYSQWCHQCKAKKEYFRICESTLQDSECNSSLEHKRKKRKNCCNKKYCLRCVEKYYGPHNRSFWSPNELVCPSCRGVCECARCSNRPKPKRRALCKKDPDTVADLNPLAELDLSEYLEPIMINAKYPSVEMHEIAHESEKTSCAQENATTVVKEEQYPKTPKIVELVSLNQGIIPSPCVIDTSGISHQSENTHNSVDALALGTIAALIPFVGVDRIISLCSEFAKQEQSENGK